jgi:hypothetical protein
MDEFSSVDVAANRGFYVGADRACIGIFIDSGEESGAGLIKMLVKGVQKV